MPPNPRIPDTRIAPGFIDPGRLLPPQAGIPRTALDGVFEGGGALGTAYVGALRYLEDSNMWFSRVAGNSAGAITAAMIAAGFTAGEIQALSSAFLGKGSLPPTLSDLGIDDPIEFLDFIDLPTADTISDEKKRKTDIWHAFNGTVLDTIGDIDLGIPTQGSTVQNAVQEVLNTPLLGLALDNSVARDALTFALNTALAALPDNPLKVKDFLPNTTALRRALADAMWDAFAEVWPTLPMLTNLLYEGSLFEGTTFVTTLRQLFGAKLKQNPAATVLFSDLKIPLAVIAANIDTGVMEVYSSRTHGSMEVIEAVRRSMSIPFVFEPRGENRQIVDGGLCSNFPVWLFTDSADKYWPSASIDSARLKVGFLLDDLSAPVNDTRPGRFTPSGTPARVPLSVALRPLLRTKLIELGYPNELVDEALRRWLGSGAGSSRVDPEMEIIEELLGVVIRGVMNTEDSTRALITGGLMRGLPYVEVVAPLLGFHALDFGVNNDGRAVKVMWDRAWKQAQKEFSLARARGSLAGTTLLTSRPSPFAG